MVIKTIKNDVVFCDCFSLSFWTHFGSQNEVLLVNLGLSGSLLSKCFLESSFGSILDNLGVPFSDLPKSKELPGIRFAMGTPTCFSVPF